MPEGRASIKAQNTEWFWQDVMVDIKMIFTGFQGVLTPSYKLATNKRCKITDKLL